jgi:hypothetical protein
MRRGTTDLDSVVANRSNPPNRLVGCWHGEIWRPPKPWSKKRRRITSRILAEVPLH